MRKKSKPVKTRTAKSSLKADPLLEPWPGFRKRKRKVFFVRRTVEDLETV